MSQLRRVVHVRFDRHSFTAFNRMTPMRVRRLCARPLSLLLIVSLLSVQTPAAPLLLTNMVRGWHTEFAL
ncbi:MAG: hypothetical protein ACRD9R_10660 [Pyrinomonadaceae bacterium]